MKEKKRERGRPTKYDPKIHDAKAFSYFCRGYTNALVAKKFGISPRTLDYWIEAHASFKESVIDGRRVSNSENELKLFKISQGFYKEIEKPFIVKGKVEIVTYKEYFPPNFPALRFLMTNRMPQDYRDKIAEAETEETSKPVAINIKVVKNDD